MTYPFPPDLAKLVQEQMTARGYTSEDEVLRDALSALGQFAHSRDEAAAEYQQTVEAIREGISDMESGRMYPLREVLGEARRKQERG